MQRKDIPNLISLIRIILVGPIVYFLLQGAHVIALLLFIVAGLSDALDGFLAKKFGWTSRLGSLLDPLADKILLVSCFLAGAIIGLLPLWLCVIILARDLIVAVGAFMYHCLVERFNGEPPFSSKLNTTFQIIYLVMLISAQSVLTIPADWLEFALYSVAATTTISGLEYVWVWGFRAWSLKMKEQHEQQ